MVADASFVALLRLASDRGRPVILDGAVGTELDNRGVDTRSPLWSGLAPMTHPAVLAEIHQEYVNAGAEVITTSTFRTTRRAFRKAGETRFQWREAAGRAVGIALLAAGSRAIVAGSVAPLEDCFRPELAPSGREAEEEHLLLCQELVRSGVHILWLETFGALGELDAASTAAARAGSPNNVPFAVSVTTDAAGNLVSGEPLEAAVQLAHRHGAAAFCVNCIPPRHVDAVLPRLLACAALPVGVYANLGFAEARQDWRGSAALSPGKYAETAARWSRAGIACVGGCCGSTPAHIAALSAKLKSGSFGRDRSL